MNLMALIRMFTIRFRMEGAIGVVLLLLGLLGGVGMWSMLRIYDLHQDFIQVPWQQNQQLQQMQSKLDALQLKEKEVLITFSRSANLDDSYSQWKADVQAVQGQMQQISQTIDASQKTNLEKLGQSVQAYVDGFGPLVQWFASQPLCECGRNLGSGECALPTPAGRPASFGRFANAIAGTGPSL